VNCQADLREFSTTAQARRRFQENNRVSYIRIMVADNCCPACREAEGAFKKEETPILPVEGCSSSNGCCCFYQPFLNELYP
jgi:hypothetical protein